MYINQTDEEKIFEDRNSSDNHNGRTYDSAAGELEILKEIFFQIKN